MWSDVKPLSEINRRFAWKILEHLYPSEKLSGSIAQYMIEEAIHQQML